MNDEATTTYYEEINQMTQGALFIQKEFGKDVLHCSNKKGISPHSIWHVDVSLK